MGGNQKCQRRRKYDEPQDTPARPLCAHRALLSGLFYNVAFTFLFRLCQVLTPRTFLIFLRIPTQQQFELQIGRRLDWGAGGGSGEKGPDAVGERIEAERRNAKEAS